LYRFALARVKDPAIAEELLQEALVSALNEGYPDQFMDLALPRRHGAEAVP